MILNKVVSVSKPLEQSEAAPILADPRPHYTPQIAADRWHWHPESVRRAIRSGRIASIIIGRRRLIPAVEIERIEREGFINRAV